MNQLPPYFKAVGIPKTFRAKAPLVFQGEVPRDVLMILDGVVRSYTITSGGEERIIGLYGKGSILPLAWATGQSPDALYYYEAMSDIRVLKVSKKDFLAITSSDPDASQALTDLVSREYTSAQLRITGLVQSRTIEKLAYTFYYLMYRYGLDRGESTLINFKLNQSLLASLIGQTREGTARNLKTLVAQGAVSYEGSSYTVHNAKLIAMLGEESFRELSERS